MADPKTAKPLSLDEIFARLEETEAFKQQAINQLLAQRKTLDEQLAKLGYSDSPSVMKPAGKKRHRRTKAELLAAKAAEG